MTKLLDGKIAIITGGASGIGEAGARILAKNGCMVALADTNAERLDRVVSDISAAGCDCFGRCADVANEAAVIDFFGETLKKWGRVDILINSAGRDSLSPPISEVSMEE